MTEPETNEAAEAKAEDKAKEPKPLSVFGRRWKKFRGMKRGWYSFIILVIAYLLSLASPLLINNRALVVSYEDELYFPIVADTVFGTLYEAKDFGQRKIGEADYRRLKREFSEDSEGGNWVLMPPYPYGPIENLLREEHLRSTRPPHQPNSINWLGTDDRGRDVFARLVYGFEVSIRFALLTLIATYIIGVAAGAILGFFGGKIDIFGQRIVEIWSGIPFLYTIIIISSVLPRSIMLLVVLLSVLRWVGISLYIRGEFYREKARDYVAAAIAQGESNLSIMFRHILPNSLTPIISFAPFALVAYISTLVALDYLGFGLPAPTPSWGELVNQGLSNINPRSYHLVMFPLAALFVTLLMVVFIGEAIREAFDPKVHARLR